MDERAGAKAERGFGSGGLRSARLTHVQALDSPGGTPEDGTPVPNPFLGYTYTRGGAGLAALQLREKQQTHAAADALPEPPAEVDAPLAPSPDADEGTPACC